MGIAAAVVVYNIHCGDSATCQALEQCRDITVLIYDNSTENLENRAYCEDRGWVYLGGNGNVGISKAYNACVDYLTQEGDSQVLCLFDDDTHLDDRYFSILETALETAEEGIFVPLIYAGGQLMSPCLLDEQHRVTRFSDSRAALSYSGNQMSAINSGMALKLSLFTDYRYDEGIFLDGVDHHFLLDMRCRGQKIRVLDYRCDHDFSGVEKPSREAARNRFRIYAKDYGYILKHDRLAYLRLVGKRALRLTMQYPSTAFFSELLRNL